MRRLSYFMGSLAVLLATVSPQAQAGYPYQPGAGSVPAWPPAYAPATPGAYSNYPYQPGYGSPPAAPPAYWPGYPSQLSTTQASTVQPNTPQQPAQPSTPQQPAQPEANQPNANQAETNQSNANNAETQPTAPEAGTEAAASANPQMLGDLGVGGYLHAVSQPAGIFRPVQHRVVHPPGRRHPTPVARVSQVRGTGATFVNLATSGFKITENEAPMPEDRVFLTYNYFNRVNGSSDGIDTSRFDVHRETFGFEKTFLDRQVSIGLRVPVFEETGDGEFGKKDIGDLSVIIKCALTDRNAGDCGLSVGMVVTAPTGPEFDLLEGESPLHSTILQPFVGYIWDHDAFYIQGFTSVLVPTDERDVTLFEDDIGIGYHLYRSQEGMITSLTPTLEAHVTIPLDHRGLNNVPDGFPDLVSVTGGVHIGLCGASTLTIGAATPLTGPKPYELEGIAQLNIRF